MRKQEALIVVYSKLIEYLETEMENPNSWMCNTGNWLDDEMMHKTTKEVIKDLRYLWDSKSKF